MAGKTVTAELASATPGPTTNPWNQAGAPGRSSMGSAAAVAGGMLRLAIGTQTAGSVSRPVAHSGMVGFKPISVMILSETIDQLRAFAATLAAAAELVSVMAGVDLGPDPPRPWTGS